MADIKKEIGIWLQVNHFKIVEEICKRLIGSQIFTNEDGVDTILEKLQMELEQLNFEKAFRTLTEELKIDCTGRGFYFLHIILKEMYESDCWEYTSDLGQEIVGEIAEKHSTSIECIEANVRYMLKKLNPKDIKETLGVNVKNKIGCKQFFNLAMCYLK